MYHWKSNESTNPDCKSLIIILIIIAYVKNGYKVVAMPVVYADWKHKFNSIDLKTRLSYISWCSSMT